MSRKNISEKDITLLENISSKFHFKDERDFIDITILLKQLKDKLPPRKIKKSLDTSFESDLFERNYGYISKYNDTNYFGVIRRKYEKRGITALFHHQENFLNAFLQRYPSPQDVNLPFWDWDLEILQHYLKLVYKKEFLDYILKKVLASAPKHTVNPFLSSSRDYINSKDFHIFIWYIIFIKRNNSKQFTHYIPIRFDYKESQTNSKALKFYEVNDHSKHGYVYHSNTIFLLLKKCIPKNATSENATSENAISENATSENATSEKCIPKNATSKKCIPKNATSEKYIFLINKSTYKEKYFKKEFLCLASDNIDLLQTKFVFIKSNDIQKIYQQNSCSDLKQFYKYFKQCQKKITYYKKYEIKDHTDNPLPPIRKILNTYFDN